MRMFICFAVLAVFFHLETLDILEIFWPYKLVMIFSMGVAFVQDLAELGRK